MYGRRHWRPTILAGVSVGLLGALTTFSTVTGELWTMLDAGDWSAFGSYAAASVFGGLTAAGAGVRLGRALR
jgi:CrcB protein